jgi:hypothetical protein
MERLTRRAYRWLLAGLAALLTLSLGCQPDPSTTELSLRATVETLRDELSRLQSPTPQVVRAVDATPTPLDLATPAPEASPTSALVASGVPDSRLLDWRAVNQQAAVGDLELQVHSLLLGQNSYGSIYGSTITAGPGRKIILADTTLKYDFRPGASPYEVHVDYFVISDANGLEYRGLPVPSVGNALTDRLFISSGQMHRGIVAFIVPQELESGLLYFTNFLGGKDPPDRLMVNLTDIPMRSPNNLANASPPTSTPAPTAPGSGSPASTVQPTPQPTARPTARLSLIEPFRGMGTVDGLLTVQWRAQLQDPARPGTVMLSYSPENVSGTGVKIADVPASAGEYRWSTSTVPQGTYWILAQLTDGAVTERRYSSTSFTVYRAVPDSPSANSAMSATSDGGPAPRTLMDERFATNQRGWRSDRSGTTWLAEDGYHLYGRDPGRFVAVGVPGVGGQRDVSVTASFRKLEAGLSAGFGVIVRDRGPEPRDGFNQLGLYSVLKTGDRSEVDAWRRDNDRWIDLLPLTQSGALRQGRELNDLTVIATGERLLLLVNGAEVASVPDPAPNPGGIGLFVHGDYTHVLVERLVVQSLV